MFFILNKLSDILGNHSYVTDLVIRNLTITKENFKAICESFYNITSLSVIDCNIELTEDIKKLNLKEVSFTNCGFEDEDLEHINSLTGLEILNFIDLFELNLEKVTAITKVKTLSLIYCELVNSEEIIKNITAEFLDIRGCKVDLTSLLYNDNLKTLVTTSTDVKGLALLKEKGVTLKLEQE